MASILFVDYQTVIPASWLNDVNNAVYNGAFPSANLTLNNLTVNTSLSGAGVTARFASPGPIGSAAASTGAFTTLSASTSISGAGFSNYFASPPAIGGTSANAGAFTSLSATSLTVTGLATFSSTGAIQLAKGTTAQQPSGTEGLFRFNTDTKKFTGYNGTAWTVMGGATGGGTDSVFYENDITVNYDYTIPMNKNAMSAGPISVASGVTVTVSPGSRWTVVV